jgi:hypothetical protein
MQGTDGLKIKLQKDTTNFGYAVLIKISLKVVLL